MADDVKTRPYVSPRRVEQARRTRREIVAAAHRLFLQQGYAGTRIEDVADAAAVAPQTVYSAVGNKRELLWAVLETATAGDDEPRTVADRIRTAMGDASDPAERLRRAMAFGRALVERSAEAHRIMRSAATADPEVAAALAEVETRRRQDARTMVDLVAGDGRRLDDVDAGRAADLFFAVTAYEVYDHLVEGCGWVPGEVEHWLTRLLEPLLT